MIDIKNTKEITVPEIISTFKGKNRKIITSSIETDDFLEAIKNKNDWTIDQYKELMLAYSLENMYRSLFDYSAIRSIARTYGFKLDWHDHFKVIENITDKKKQSKYLNYYFWYYHSDMTEALYQDLMAKPYYHLLSSKSKSSFVQHNLKTDNATHWLNKYFTTPEIINGLKLNLLYVDIALVNQEAQIQKIKDFYNQYEKFMSQNTKARFFYQAVRTGLIPLIKFLYQEKGITKINKVVLLWNVCSDISQPNTLEILHCLKEMGIKFNDGLLQKVKSHTQWGYMEYTDILQGFFANVKMAEMKK